MQKKQKRAWAQIHLENIAHNVEEIRRVLPGDCLFLGVVKANAYGHGAVPVARCIEEAGGGYLGVACLDEAAELREAGLTLPILILGPTPARFAGDLAELGVTQSVPSLAYARELSGALTGDQRLKVHLKLDSGMGRLGFRADDEAAQNEAAIAASLPHFETEGVFTHFAVSDEPDKNYTDIQSARFLRAISALEAQIGRPFALRHCANSGAVLNYRELCLDMVRPGLLTYGLYPAAETGGLTLRPGMELKARVADVTHHKRGDTISYGRTFKAERDCTLAVVSAGYADGVHRVLSNRMDVLIHGQRAHQVGRICMDMFMADVTELDEVRPGDVATIFGWDGECVIPVEEQAEKAGTISYELVCAVSPRVERIYE